LTAALWIAALAGCTGDVPIPFFSTQPASPGPPLVYPSLAAPPEDENRRDPLMTEADQQAMEAKLKQQAIEREAAVRRRILRDK
jgi:hypothetical protein